MSELANHNPNSQNHAPYKIVAGGVLQFSQQAQELGTASTIGIEGDPSPEKGSYENGWGFFDEGSSLTPTEFTFTADDDLYVDTKFLGLDRSESFSDVDRSLPLNPERRAVCEQGICRAIETKWGLEQGKLTSIHSARNYLQLVAQNNPGYKDKPQAIYYQNISNNPQGKKLSAYAKGSSDYLHFGNSQFRHFAAPDKLDAVMRVYVHTPPEFAGHVASEVLQAVTESAGSDLYLKLHDCSTGEVADARNDNLILYAKSHSELVAIATTLRKLASLHPEMFDAKAVPLDKARQTDIPGVSLAEEPVQDENGIKESFNSSRELIEESATKEVFRRYLIRNPKLITRYGVTDSDIGFSPQIKGREIMRERFARFDDETKLKFRRKLKDALREEVRKCSVKQGVSPHNFAMNMRSWE